MNIFKRSVYLFFVMILITQVSIAQNGSTCKTSYIITGEGEFTGKGLMEDSYSMLPIYYQLVATESATYLCHFEIEQTSTAWGGGAEIFQSGCLLTNKKYSISSSQLPYDFSLSVKPEDTITFVLFTPGTNYSLKLSKGVCYPTTGFSSEAISPSKIKIAWDITEGVNSYEYLVLESGTALSESDKKTTTNTTATTTDLKGSTSYDIYLRNAGCSTWQKFTQTTLGCQPAENIAISNLTSTSATVTWDTSDKVDYWQLSYSLSGLQNGAIIQVTSNSYKLINLTNQTDYDVFVRGNSCSTWNKITFTTPHPCDVSPNILTRVDYNEELTDNYVTLLWPLMEANVWDVEYSLAENGFTGTPDIENEDSIGNAFGLKNFTTIAIQDLDPGINYYVKVRPVCTDKTGEWSTTYTINAGEVITNENFETAKEIDPINFKENSKHNNAFRDFPSSSTCSNYINGVDRVYKFKAEKDGTLSGNLIVYGWMSELFIYKNAYPPDSLVECNYAMATPQSFLPPYISMLNNVTIEKGKEYYIGIITNPNDSFALQLNVKYNTITGNKSPLQNIISISATYVEDDLFINVSGETKTAYRIINPNGIIIKEGDLRNSDNNRISVTSLMRGLYLIQITEGDRFKTYKFFKN